MTDIEIEDLALALIGLVDYDIKKECEHNLNSGEVDELVEEVMYFIQELINLRKKNDRKNFR